MIFSSSLYFQLAYGSTQYHRTLFGFIIFYFRDRMTFQNAVQPQSKSRLKWSCGTKVDIWNKSKNRLVPHFKPLKSATLKGFKDGCTDFGTGTKVAKGNTSPLATFVFKQMVLNLQQVFQVPLILLAFLLRSNRVLRFV